MSNFFDFSKLSQSFFYDFLKIARFFIVFRGLLAPIIGKNRVKIPAR